MSIAAINWAMQQKTDGPSAQIILFIIADAASDKGVCVHADPDYIAERSRQSRATVFRRLNEMEAEGLLTRFKKFRPDGAPIYEIRLAMDKMFDYDRPRSSPNPATEDECAGEALSADDAGPQMGEIGDPIPFSRGESQFETLTCETGGVSPVRLAESHSCDFHKNPPKSPDSPQSPPLPALEAATGSELAERSATAPASEPAEPEGFTDFLAVHPGAAFSDRGKIAHVFIAMTPAERISARAAARAYAADLARYKRKPKNADRWLRERGWEAYPGVRLPEAAPQREFVDDPVIIAAMRVRYRLERPAMRGELALSRHEDGRYGLWMRRAPEPDVLALAHFVDLPVSDWTLVRDGTPEFHAWRERIHQWFGQWPDTERVWIEPHDPDAHDVRFSHPNWRIRKSVPGLRVPCTWPPLKDGTLSTAPPSLIEDVDAEMAQELAHEFEGG